MNYFEDYPIPATINFPNRLLFTKEEQHILSKLITLLQEKATKHALM